MTFVKYHVATNVSSYDETDNVINSTDVIGSVNVSKE